MRVAGQVAVGEGAVEEWIKAYRGCCCGSGSGSGRVGGEVEGGVGMRLYGENCWRFEEEMVDMLMSGGVGGGM